MTRSVGARARAIRSPVPISPRKQRGEAQPEGRAGGARLVASGHIRVIRSLEDSLKIQVSAGQVRRGRHQIKIVGVEGTRLIREREATA